MKKRISPFASSTLTIAIKTMQSSSIPRKRGRPAKANFQKAFSLPIELWEKVVDKLEREKGLGVEHGLEIPIGTQSDLIIELLTKWLEE